MDVFRLILTGNTWAKGEAISGIDTKLWTERYRTYGEFKFTAKPTHKLLDALPIGALISHTDTLDVMFVEDHEIVENRNSEPLLTITGRGLESFLEQRVATEDHMGFISPINNGPLYDGSPWPYVFDQHSQRSQILALIRAQIQEGYVERAQHALPNTKVIHEIETNSPEEEREVKRGYLYGEVTDLLADMGAGIRIERPNGTRKEIYWIIHDGTNLSKRIQFFHDAGDLESSRYFKTNKTDKNAAYAQSAYWYKYWFEEEGATGFNRRVMFLDCTDIKLNPNRHEALDISTKRRVEAMLNRRAGKVVRMKKRTDILEATLSADTRFQYRTDYNIGDLVYVVGNYDTSDVMRVVEYVETEDDEGDRGFPTLVRAPGY